MTITEKQIEERKHCIGGSDAAAIICFDPMTVWVNKVHGVDQEASEPMLLGIALETPLIEFAEPILGKMQRNQRRQVKESTIPFYSNIDAIVNESGEPVEAKTSGLLWAAAADGWGEPDTDEVPEYVCIQAHSHMMATEREICHVVAWLPRGRGRTMFHVKRSEPLCTSILTIVERFWNDYVLTGIPPQIDDNYRGDALKALARIKRVPGKLAKVNADFVKTVNRLEVAKLAITEFKRIEKAAKTQIVVGLGDAEGAELPDGRMVVYVEESRAGHTVKPYTFRTPRIKTKPKGDDDGRCISYDT